MFEEMSCGITLTDLSTRSGDVVEATFRGPVEITRRGKRKFVLLTAEECYASTANAIEDRSSLAVDKDGRN
jgi:prevent-host-death family protein